MMPLVGISILSIIIIGIAGMYSVIEDQQELSEINYDVVETQMQMIQESTSVTGTINSDLISIKNSMNEDVELIQIRVYDESGNFVMSFPMNSIIPSNSELSLTSLPQELQDMILDDGSGDVAPLSNYQFEDDLSDSTGNGNTGTKNGAGTELYVAGHDGKAFNFNGNTHITVGDSPFDFERTDAFSLATHFKTSVTGVSDLLFGKMTAGGVGYQMFLKDNNQIRVRISSSDIFKIDTVGANVRDGNWHHVAMTYDGSSSASGVTFYVDGVESSMNIVRDDTLTGSIQNNNPLIIGNQRPETSFFFTGQMDDVRIYNFELTPEQVENIVNP